MLLVKGCHQKGILIRNLVKPRYVKLPVKQHSDVALTVCADLFGFIMFQDHTGATPSEHSPPSGSESSMANQTGLSPNNDSSRLMLSISTIASAIANASISTDPSQLAAMIVDLSKKNRGRNRPESSATHKRGPNTAQHVR